MSIQAKIKRAKIVKAGNSYAIRVPAAFVKNDMLSEDKEYDVEILLHDGAIVYFDHFSTSQRLALI